MKIKMKRLFCHFPFCLVLQDRMAVTRMLSRSGLFLTIPVTEPDTVDFSSIPERCQVYSWHIAARSSILSWFFLYCSLLSVCLPACLTQLVQPKNCNITLVSINKMNKNKNEIQTSKSVKNVQTYHHHSQHACISHQNISLFLSIYLFTLYSMFFQYFYWKIKCTYIASVQDQRNLLF